jgi:biopolymer transport protein ExbB
MGIIYMGGPIVHILILFMITVIVFAFERFFVLRKAAGTGNLENFVIKVRNLLNKNKIDEAVEECDAQKGSVGNLRSIHLTMGAALGFAFRSTHETLTPYNICTI